MTHLYFSFETGEDCSPVIDVVARRILSHAEVESVNSTDDKVVSSVPSTTDPIPEQPNTPEAAGQEVISPSPQENEHTGLIGK